MKLEIKRTIDIDIEEIKKDICERGCKVSEAVHDYICGLDDDLYSLIGSEEYEQIIEELKKEGFED